MNEKRKIVEIDDVSIMFNLAQEKVDNIKEYIIRKIKGTINFQEFWALKNVTCDIYAGEPLGIIGLNGSGKSTLLKVIAGVLKPTDGSLRIYGSVAPLIELGAGFDPDFTALENIYLNGAILGHNREKMKDKVEEIIAFSELEEFINVPVKNFSSGMLARLAFAVATSHYADILIVDEILSVGDYRFKEKCEDRIKQIIAGGSTVILVSHTVKQVKDVCKKALWLEKGKIVMYGDATEVCDLYEPPSEDKDV